MMKISAMLAFCLLNCVNAMADIPAPPFQQVFDVLASPHIYNTTIDQLLLELKPWCVASTRPKYEQYKHGNVECRTGAKAKSITISSGAKRQISLIDVSFEGIANCAYMRKALIKNFGKPTTAASECDLEWRLPTPKDAPARYVIIEAATAKDEIYFSIGEEQGP